MDMVESLLKLAGLSRPTPANSTVYRRQKTLKVCISYRPDAPVLPSLLGQIDPYEALLTISGDSAYDTKACHEAIALRQAQAIIPIRKNRCGASVSWARYHGSQL
jgi:hypothetical protein